MKTRSLNEFTVHKYSESTGFVHLGSATSRKAATAIADEYERAPDPNFQPRATILQTVERWVTGEDGPGRWERSFEPLD